MQQPDLVLEADFAKNVRDLVDGSALLLSELETMAFSGQPPKAGEEEVVLEQIVDGLLRKLMASGHSLSDEKLQSSIDGVLNNEMFSKVAMGEAALGADSLGISDIDV